MAARQHPKSGQLALLVWQQVEVQADAHYEGAEERKEGAYQQQRLLRSRPAPLVRSSAIFQWIPTCGAGILAPTCYAPGITQ
jgi:hypothetical protein